MTGPSEDVVVRRRVAVSPEEAFEVWTQPQHVEQWWSPAMTGRCTLCEIDLRPGGQYRLNLRDPVKKMDCRVWGEFREIDRPRKLVYMWNAETSDGNVYDTEVTVEFLPVGEETEVRLTHRGLPEDAKPGHRQGWTGMLDSYVRHVKTPHSI